MVLVRCEYRWPMPTAVDRVSVRKSSPQADATPDAATLGRSQISS